jgi:hypothetical protein
VSSIERSRPAALAAEIAAEAVSVIEDLFTAKNVLLRLEPELLKVPQAAQTLLLLANEILRFCPNVSAELPLGSDALFSELEAVAIEIHGHPTVARGSRDIQNYDAIVNVGTEIHAIPNWITVNSDGWLCRVGTSHCGKLTLPDGYSLPNPFGALGAACLGAGQAFLCLIGAPLLERPVELSLYTLEQAAPGELDAGPGLEPVTMDVLLVGCGGVANGWVYAMRRAPVFGRVEPVDHQSIRAENLGPYVCSSQYRITVPKVQVVRDELEPKLTVLPRPERFRFFTARLNYGQSYVPRIVISALDNPPTRHQVQRLWAPLTIDLAAEGLTAQVIVKKLDDDGICLLEAHTDPLGTDAELVELAAATGLSIERLRDFESQVTEEDIANAPPEKQAALEEACRQGTPICGRVGDLDLYEEEAASEFTPAVPFVTAFAGIVAAAQTVRAELGSISSIHFQFSFQSYRSRGIPLRCRSACQCQNRGIAPGQRPATSSFGPA